MKQPHSPPDSVKSVVRLEAVVHTRYAITHHELPRGRRRPPLLNAETAPPFSPDARSHRLLPTASRETTTPPDKHRAAGSIDNPQRATAQSSGRARTAGSQTNTANRVTCDGRVALTQIPSLALPADLRHPLPTSSPKTPHQRSDTHALANLSRQPHAPRRDRCSQTQTRSRDARARSASRD